MQELIDHRAGNSAPLKKFLTDHVVEPWLKAPWVQADLHAHHAAEYLSQLHTGLGNVLKRLKDPKTMPDVALAKDVERYCRYELRHTREQMYKFRRKGDKGHARAYVVLRRQRSDKPIQGRDDEEVRCPTFIDDPTITNRDPTFTPSKYDGRRMQDIDEGAEVLDEELIELRWFVIDQRELDLWLKLFFRPGLHPFRNTGLQPKYAKKLIGDLRERRGPRCT